MSFRSVVALAAFLATANAHMIMESPTPYSVDKLDSSPITANNYPCKSDIGYTVTKMNSMAVGQKQTLSFKGSAVHGGGSCQLSVTTDTEPTKNSVFKVIKSIEGGCPGINGPEKFDFELPDSIPNGKATFAWTWFAKLSGGPEMYMNCAPIEVTGGASDKSKFNALPDMLVANIASTTCKSQTSKALKFPSPGSEVQTAGDGTDVLPPTGDCGATGTTPSQPSSPASKPSSAPSAPAGQPSAAPSSPAGKPSVSAAPPSTPSSPGGVFAPGASSAAPVVSSAAPVVPSAAPAPQSTLTTLVTVTAKPSVPAPAQPTAPSAPGTATPPQPSSPSTGTGSTKCSTNGAVVCNGEKQFGLCNNGNVVWQAVAAGTSCVNGVISKRSYNGRIARPRI